jgi:hypothetical protein
MRWMAGLVIAGLMVSAALAVGAANAPTPAPLADLLQAYPGLGVFAPQGQVTQIYGRDFGQGDSPELAAQDFINTHSAVFGALATDLAPGRLDGIYTTDVMTDPLTGVAKFTLLYYTQVRDGVPVFDSELRVLVRNLPGNPVVLAASSLHELGTFNVAAARIAATDEPQAYRAAAAETPGLSSFTPTELVIWAGSVNERAAPTLAVSFIASGFGAANEPLRQQFVCDAATGAVLYSRNLIHFVDVTGTVTGMATDGIKSDACNAESLHGMPYAKVQIGTTTAYADVNGNFTIPNSGSTSVTVSSPMSGQYFVVNGTGTPETVSQTVTPPGPASLVHNAANTDAAIRAQFNAYYQANRVRNWVLYYSPGYPTIATQTGFGLYVNRTDNYCPGNAWYDGVSLNFCSASGSYANTAYQSVVFHEYGHHVVEMAGSGQDQYGEGMGDCISMLDANDPILGYGFTGSCTAGIRTAVNTMQYPCTSDIHTCAQLLSGCVWSARLALANTHPADALAIISELTVNSVLLHTGGTIAPDITTAFLTLDDDDANLNNGTPHYSEICTGFNAHAMTCPALQALSITFPNGQPAFIAQNGGTRLRVRVAAGAAQPVAGSGQFYYKVGTGAWQSAAMEVVSASDYDAVFPAAPCGAEVRYYFSATAVGGTVIYEPTGSSSAPLLRIAGGSASTPVNDTFETDLGWTVGDTGDTATLGLWTRNVPQATDAQPGSDHTPGSGTMCWITDYRAGSSVGTYDVDGGKTTLKSPIFNLSSAGSAMISYWRWYSNTAGAAPNADTFRVDISNDGGTNWVNAETVGPTGAQAGGGWYYYEFSATSKVALTSQIRLRYVAEDAGSGSVVEAAVDDFRIDVVACAPAYAKGDLNCSGAVGFDDINPFVLALTSPASYATSFPSCDIMLADINSSGAVGFDDINPFVALLTGGK